MGLVNLGRTGTAGRGVRRSHAGRWMLAVIAGAAMSMHEPALAQQTDLGADAPEWLVRLAGDPSSPAAVRYREQQARRVAVEREMRRLRFQHFDGGKPTTVRQEGIAKMRDYTDPALFPLMEEVFGKEAADVRLALMDHYVDSATPEGDTALAYVAIFDGAKAYREEATRRLLTRREKAGETPDSVRIVVFEGLRTQHAETMASAAHLADQLGMVEAIPWLISAQVTGARAGAGGSTPGNGRRGDLAWIMVGQQVAYVSDLTPVVGPNAVAFDPQLSVINTGTLLRVIDAVVVTYHIDVHNSLVALSSRLWGQSTAGLGWDLPGWRGWYRDVFKPLWAEREKARLAREQMPQTPRDEVKPPEKMPEPSPTPGGVNPGVVDPAPTNPAPTNPAPGPG